MKAYNVNEYILGIIDSRMATKPILYSTANDPETANDPQNRLQMILDRKWSPKSTANDPERKIGMAWTQVCGSLC